MTEIKYYAIIRELQISERERVRVRNLNESVCAYLKKRLPGKLHFTFFYFTKTVSTVIHSEGS